MLGLDMLGAFMPDLKLGRAPPGRDALTFEPPSIPVREGLPTLGRAAVLGLERTVETTGLRVTDPVRAGPLLAGTRVRVTALVAGGRDTARPTGGARVTLADGRLTTGARAGVLRTTVGERVGSRFTVGARVAARATVGARSTVVDGRFTSGPRT